MVTWSADEYAKNSIEQQRWARELIAKLALRGDERVLDIGCGDGKVTAEIAAAVPRGSVVAIDSSAEMVRYARERFGELPNFEVRHMDARNMTFGREFDVVFSNAVLHWVVDHRPVLRGIGEALRAGGRMLLQMGGRGNAATVFHILSQVIQDEPWAPYFRGFSFNYGFYTPEEYRPWLESAGLRPVRVELIPKQMIYADKDALSGWFRTTWTPWIGRVPESQQARFVAEVVDTYVEAHPPDESGRISLPMMRLEVEAVSSQEQRP